MLKRLGRRGDTRLADHAGAADVAAGGLWAGGPPTAARSPRTPLPRTSGSQPVVQSLTWIPGTDPQWAAGDLSSAGDGTAVLEYGT